MLLQACLFGLFNSLSHTMGPVVFCPSTGETCSFMEMQRCNTVLVKSLETFLQITRTSSELPTVLMNKEKIMHFNSENIWMEIQLV